MNASWNDRIRNSEATPPPNAWQNIAERLENDAYEWKDNIYESEVNPPSSAWQNIEAVLDTAWPERVKDSSIDPPKETWPKIESRLDDQKVIPINKNRFRIAVAAAAVLVVAAGLLFFLNKSSVQQDSSNTGIVSVQPQTKTPDNNIKAVSPVPAEPEIVASDAPTGQMQPAVQIRPAKKVLAKTVRANVRSGNNIALASLSRQDKTYITICGPKDEPVQLSSKFLPVVGVQNHHLQVDDLITGCEDWKQKLCEWREKMINSSLVPGTGNFLDILDLTRTLSEEK